jgi:hypothetical protein
MIVTTIRDDIKAAKAEIDECYRQIRLIKEDADWRIKPLYLEIQRWKIALKDYKKIERETK